MVIDDDRDVRDLVATVLTLIVDQVVACGDGEEGVQLVADVDPDLLVLDLALKGGLDGVQVAAQVRRRAGRCRPRILLLTASSDSDVIQAGFDAGADAHLTKPFGVDVLLGEVRRLLQPDPDAGEKKS